MGESPQFPNDENGTVLRRMLDAGDDLSEARRIDFSFVFLERRQALAFAEIVEEREMEVCISYYAGREMWQSQVHRYMIPTHQDITALELELTERAESVGGEADGWGCMAIKKK
jgi:hypothetical protein